MTLQQIGKLRYLVQVSPLPKPRPSAPSRKSSRNFAACTAQRNEREQPTSVGMDATTGLMLDDTAAVSYESPYAVARAAMLVTAKDSETLYRGIFNLQDRQYWDNLTATSQSGIRSQSRSPLARLGQNSSTKFPIRPPRAESVSTAIRFYRRRRLPHARVLAFVLRSLLKKREKKS